MRPVFAEIAKWTFFVILIAAGATAYFIREAEVREAPAPGLMCSNRFPQILCEAIVNAPPGSGVQTVEAIDDLLHWKINMHVRRDYCAQHSIDLSNYRRAFARKKSRMAREAIRKLEIVGLSQDSVWQAFEEKSVRLVEKDMERRGRKLGGPDGKAACERMKSKPDGMVAKLDIERHTPIGPIGHLPIFK